ncbi:MAG: hypothetical protein ABH852_02825 [Methanobacteriota archaeon]
MESPTAKHAIRIGFKRDIPLCIGENYIDIVPIIKNGRIAALGL